MIDIEWARGAAKSRPCSPWPQRMAALVLALALVLPLLALSAGPARAEESELSPGDSGPRVVALQEMLRAQGFYRGAVDGVFGPWMEAAVVAFHKEVQAPRDAIWRSEDWELLARYRWPWLPFRPEEPDRVEVNLSAQVLYLIEDHLLTAVIPISSGNEELFRNWSGGMVPAHTPRGDFRFQRHVEGWRISYLGELYRPWYFLGGYAVHGSPSVPPYPASHGCVRVPMWEADFLAGRLFVGMPVHVWDAPAGIGPSFHDQPIPELVTPPFVDDEGSVHEADIGALADKQITKGCGTFRFCPGEPVTRGQLAAFLVRALKLPAANNDFFSDDQGSVFQADINALAAAQITKGCGGGRFCPDLPATRAEMAALLARALELPPAERDFFGDDNGNQHEAEINAMAAKGITNGCAAGSFCPHELTSRAEMASFLVRAPLER